ncbi:hypothetical protein PPL_08436 [Heterostelium album PN500]|uniref:Uncharacterized protein n=1 Tax=Heterostelium pallidum (strain ATCC 26659 / Pp 5 / PN500) TaxID=670386 RepID=D3BI68_HETP5|nr:hypothetical protein PPL_08436 [Heterostelium album PN500]EFA78968.1 hypothetical protein PPL_08436 [Heterostelium album PN500]|eukprot:XP_020431092.1 hypothetical protein PPL_08436 [Heterostelium album PN500]
MWLRWSSYGSLIDDMLEDNDVWSAGGNITAAEKKARSIGGFSLNT